MNKPSTCIDSGTKLTQPRSGPVRYELVSYRGEIFGPFDTVSGAAAFAKIKWPRQEQDEDRTGRGWDVQTVGCDR